MEVSWSLSAAPVWGAPSSSWGTVWGQVQDLPPGMLCRRSGVLLLPEVKEAGSRRTRGRAPWLGTRRADGWGVCLGRARPRRLQGKFSRQSEGWRPGREQPRCSWAGRGRQQKALERSGSLAAGKGAPLLGGVAAGGGGRSGGGLMAKYRQVRRRSCARRASHGVARNPDPARCVRFPGRPGGWLREGRAHSCLDPAFGAPSPTPSARPAMSRTGGTIALRLQ